MAHITQAEQGLAAVEARNWEEGLEHLNKALKGSLNPNWLIARSKALIGLRRPLEALHDAELAWFQAAKRSKRELMSTAQYRRGVAFHQLKQYANADYCYMHCIRLLQGGPAVPKDDPGLALVNEGGFWTMTAAAATEDARNQDMNKKESSLSKALGGSDTGGAAESKSRERRMASQMRIQALAAMEKLPEDDVGRKLTTTLVPDERHLLTPETVKDRAEAEEAAAAAEKAAEAKAVEDFKAEAAQEAAAKLEVDKAEAAKVAAEKKAAVLAIPNDTPLRLQDFQSNTNMSVSIFSKSVDKAKLQVEFSNSAVRLDPLVYPNGYEGEFTLDLWGEIVPEKSSYIVTPSKVELSLAKKTPGKWAALKSDASSKAPVPQPQVAEISPKTVEATPAPTATKDKEPAATSAPAYPSSSRSGPKNWDQVGADENSDDEKDINLFFKKLYKGATPEQQRAMMKSFSESNGTSLSTNWDDVKDKRVETVPPEGVEPKKWES